MNGIMTETAGLNVGSNANIFKLAPNKEGIT